MTFTNSLCMFRARIVLFDPATTAVRRIIALYWREVVTMKG
jgi:hypothetical protein